MGKFKIPKNRDISEMFAGVEEKETFETAIWEEEQPSVKNINRRLNKVRQHSDGNFLMKICRKK